MGNLEKTDAQGRATILFGVHTQRRSAVSPKYPMLHKGRIDAMHAELKSNLSSVLTQRLLVGSNPRISFSRAGVHKRRSIGIRINQFLAKCRVQHREHSGFRQSCEGCVLPAISATACQFKFPFGTIRLSLPAYPRSCFGKSRSTTAHT